MFFLFSNGARLFIPAILPSEDTLATWPVLKFLYALELIFIFTMCPAAIILITALSRSLRLFHRNLRQIAQFHLIMYVVQNIIRVYLLLYDTSLIETTASIDRLLFSLFFIRFSMLCGAMTFIPSVIAERTFASRYVGDYESADRPWISYLINGSSLSLATCYCALIMLGFYSVLVLVLVSMLITMLSSFSIIMVYRRDAEKLRDLSNKTGRSKLNYTLSMKFQLEENVRVTKMLTYASIALSIYTICSCLLFGTAFLVFGEKKPLGQLTYALWNVYQAVSFAAVVWSSLAAIGWLQRLLQCFLGFVCYRDQRTTIQKISATVQDSHYTTERYFNQLESAWERHGISSRSYSASLISP